MNTQANSPQSGADKTPVYGLGIAQSAGALTITPRQLVYSIAALAALCVVLLTVLS